MRELYRAREKSRLDMISKLKYAESKGKKEGKEEERKKLARNLLMDGMEVALVSKYTKLTVDEIKKIKENIK